MPNCVKDHLAPISLHSCELMYCFDCSFSGFMGKVLVEKLLYSCSELDRIYLLLRNKRGVKAEDRLAALYSSKVSWHPKLVHLPRIRDRITEFTGQKLGVYCNIFFIFYLASNVCL